jgi:dCTP diphosphatase
MAMSDLEKLQDAVLAFVRERDWEQFHSPKNLAMALIVECAELTEEFQWLTEDASRQLPSDKRDRVADELADIFIYLLRLGQVLDINLVGAATAKLAKNGVKYPVDKAKGNAQKYSEY